MSRSAPEKPAGGVGRKALAAAGTARQNGSVGGLNGTVPAVMLMAGLAFWAVSLVDFARTDLRRVRTLSREAWTLVIVLGSVVGAAAWWAFGRPRRR